MPLDARHWAFWSTIMSLVIVHISPSFHAIIRCWGVQGSCSKHLWCHPDSSHLCLLNLWLPECLLSATYCTMLSDAPARDVVPDLRDFVIVLQRQTSKQAIKCGSGGVIIPWGAAGEIRRNPREHLCQHPEQQIPQRRSWLDKPYHRTYNQNMNILANAVINFLMTHLLIIFYWR